LSANPRNICLGPVFFIQTPEPLFMNDHPPFGTEHDALPLSRRAMLQRSGLGLGALSLATLLGENLLGDRVQAAATASLVPKEPHFKAKAKRIIQIFAYGAPSQVDTWDPKPALAKYANQALPDLRGKAFPSPFQFKKHGQSGIEVSEVFPKLGEHVDEMAVIRSLYTDIPAHEVAQIFMNTGSLRLSRPSLGSWLLYGLGSTNQNLPGFMALRNGGAQPSMTESCSASFLPGVYAGTQISTAKLKPDEILENLRNPFMGIKDQRKQLDFVSRLNSQHSANLQHDAQLEARLQAFEMAFKMQTEATDAFDLAKESTQTRELYGDTSLGNQLLLARRLVERGVRVVQVWHGSWDMHNDLEGNMTKRAAEVDQPAAALLSDLKARGMLEDTLVLWGGEFGRTVTFDNNGNEKPGRDHNNKGFCCWMAGGGVKGGTVYGATDEFGASATVDRVHVHDFHATLLALMGFDHTRLVYNVNGRDFRLTNVSGNVIKAVLA
jgi:hypothetical protein